jgi:hypothetical protein
VQRQNPRIETKNRSDYIRFNLPGNSAAEMVEHFCTSDSSVDFKVLCSEVRKKLTFDAALYFSNITICSVYIMSRCYLNGSNTQRSTCYHVISDGQLSITAHTCNTGTIYVFSFVNDTKFCNRLMTSFYMVSRILSWLDREIPDKTIVINP